MTLEERWVASVLALEENERQTRLARVPAIKDTIDKAQEEAAMPAATLVGGDQLSHISPTGHLVRNRQEAETPPDPRLLMVKLRGFEPLTSSMPFTFEPRSAHGEHDQLSAMSVIVRPDARRLSLT